MRETISTGARFPGCNPAPQFANMNPLTSEESGGAAIGGGHWATAAKSHPALAAKAIRELAESYWYPVYEWWRRAGCTASRAAQATEACFSRWIETEPPRPQDPGAGRLRTWLLERLPAMAAAGVKPRDAVLIKVDRAWAEQLYATEPEGSPDGLFARRLAIELLEFTLRLIQQEDAAAGNGAQFESLRPRLRIVAGEQDEPAVTQFRQRFRQKLRALVADIIIDPRDVDDEIATLLAAAGKHDTPGSPLPEIFGGLTPGELFAWGLAPRTSTAPQPAPAPIRVARPAAAKATPVAQPQVAKAVPLAAVPGIANAGRRNAQRKMGMWPAIAAGIAVAAVAAWFALRPDDKGLSYAERMAMENGARPKPAPVAAPIKPIATPTLAQAATPTPTPAPTPAPTPEPAMVATAPAPTPAPTPTPGPVSEFTKWLEGTAAQVQAAYEREVRAPFDTAVDRALQQYTTVIDTAIASADAAGKRDIVLALREERRQASSGQATTDSTTAPALPELKPLLTQWRGQYARLDKERYDRAKALHARIDPGLAKSEATLTLQKRDADAAALKALREKIAGEWLTPPAGQATTPNAPPVPSAPRIRLAAPALLARLLSLNCRVIVREQPGNMVRTVETPLDLQSDRFEFYEVEFRAPLEGRPPLTDADLELLDQLPGLTHLVIIDCQITDATLARLRSCRELVSLRLETLPGITPDGLKVLDSLQELRSLALVELPIGDAAVPTLAKLTKLTKLRINDLPLSSAAFAAVCAMPAIEDLEFGGGKIQLASNDWAEVAGMRKLTRIAPRGGDIDVIVTTHIAKNTHITHVNFEGLPVDDAIIAPLASLTRLTGMNLKRTKVTGTGFKSWGPHNSFTHLSMDGCPGLDDEALKAIASAFPRLDTLEVGGTGTNYTAAGIAALDRLRSLTTLRIFGESVTDAIAAELAKLDSLVTLGVGKSTLTEQGLATLSRLPKLSRLYIVNPPITDGALKALKKFRALRDINLGEDTPPATFARLRSDLQGIAVRR